MKRIRVLAILILCLSLFAGTAVVSAEPSEEAVTVEEELVGAPARSAKPTKDAKLSAGIYTISVKADQGKVLTIEDSSYAQGTPLTIHGRTGRDNQKFVITPLGSGLYSITNYASGRSLDIYGNRKVDKTPVQQYRRNQTAAQKFRIRKAEDGSCTISPSSCDLVFDLAGGKATDGNKIRIYTFNGTAAQFFRFEKAGASAPSSGTYVIHSCLNDAKALDIAGASVKSGANLQIYQSNYSNAQKFTLTLTPDGTYLVSSACSSLALDVQGGKSANKTNVRQYEANGSKAQRWTITPQSDGSYTFTPGCAAQSALDVAGGRSDNKTNVQIYRSNGSKSQKFTLEKVDMQRVVPQGCYSIGTALDRSKVLDVPGASVKDQANVQIYQSNKTAAQQFYLTYLGNGYYTFRNINSGKYLHVENGSSAKGMNVFQYRELNMDHQKWRILEAGGGYYILQSAVGTVLDIKGARTANKTNVQTWTPNGSNAQKFFFTPEKPSATKKQTTPKKTSKKHLVAIDAGHQRHGMSALEPNGPGSSTKKAKVTSGTYGNWSGLNEYELNLQVALKLEKELKNRGYDVYMIRTTHDVELSNVQRAQMATSAGAEIFVRIHANSSDSSSVRGAMAYQPSNSNPYLSKSVIRDSQRLSSLILNAQCEATGLPNRGLLTGDDMTGINWATMPVTIVEMGFMSNRTDDLYMASSSGQAAIVKGIANGIDQYFG